MMIGSSRFSCIKLKTNLMRSHYGKFKKEMGQYKRTFCEGFHIASHFCLYEASRPAAGIL